MVDSLGPYLLGGCDAFGGGCEEKEGNPRICALGATPSLGGIDGSGDACRIDKQMLHSVRHVAEFVVGVKIPLGGHHLVMTAQSILM